MPMTTPLHKAAQHGHIKAVQLLLDHNAKVDIVLGPYDEQTTALTKAYHNDHYKIVKLLLEHGADIEYMGQLEREYRRKIQSNRFDKFKALVTSIGINRGDEYGITPLMVASEYGSIEHIQYLINNGADIDIKDVYGHDAMYRAIKNKRHDSIMIFMNHRIVMLQRSIVSLLER
jgi:ankyrin repeat protein